MFLEFGDNVSDLIINEHHLIKLNSRELYNMQLILNVENMQLILNVENPTAQIYFEKNFQNLELEWKDKYT